jgi:hypothetical protein
LERLFFLIFCFLVLSLGFLFEFVNASAPSAAASGGAGVPRLTRDLPTQMTCWRLPFDRVAVCDCLLQATASGINPKALRPRAVTLHMTKPPAPIKGRAAMMSDVPYAYRLDAIASSIRWQRDEAAHRFLKNNKKSVIAAIAR